MFLIDGLRPRLALMSATLAATALAGGCSLLGPAAPTPAPAPAPVQTFVPPPAPPAPPVTIYVPVVDPADQAARQLLAYQERLALLGPPGSLGAQALAPELQRLGDGSASPQAAVELALLLGATRTPGDLQRALGLLEGVQRNPDAAPWHGLARLLATRYTEQRRSEEQAERLAQQLRDAQRESQRRLDQLNEKLEALKAIERSLNSRPPAAAAPPGSAARPTP